MNITEFIEINFIKWCAGMEEVVIIGTWLYYSYPVSDMAHRAHSSVRNYTL